MASYPYAINYAPDYDDALNGVITQDMVTGILDTPSQNINWLTAKTFMLANRSTGGLMEHGRGKGYNPNVLNVTDEPLTLMHDRDSEWYVDVMDEAETARKLQMGSVLNQFVREHVAPERDAYNLMKLANYAAQAGNSTTEQITSANVFAVINRITGQMRSNGMANTVLYVSSAVMDAISNSDEFQRVFVVNPGTIAETNITTRIGTYNGFRFVEVWDSNRMYNAFNFTQGFQPIPTVSQPINILGVYTPKVISVVRHNSIYMHAPGAVGQGDGWLLQYRIYWDTFLRPNATNAVVASVGNAVT